VETRELFNTKNLKNYKRGTALFMQGIMTLMETNYKFAVSIEDEIDTKWRLIFRISFAEPSASANRAS
jgi:hypothetical protein